MPQQQGARSLTASPRTPGDVGDQEESPWPSPRDRSTGRRGGASPQWAHQQQQRADEDQKVYDDDGSAMLPKLHLYAYRGDLSGVLQCITDGHSVHDTIIMRNQAGRLVCGITPLFLAAQRGHYKLVKLLVGNGANPAQPAYIQGSADLCTPLQVARLNLHFKVTMYLKKATAARKEEGKVLREEEEGIQGAQQRNNPQADPGRGAQQAVMANLGDLTGWDPGSGAQPPLQTGNLIARMLKRNKVDLMAWRPDVERTKDGEEQMRASEHRAVDPNELEQLEVANHTSILNNFLQDADLAQWNPDADETQSARDAPATSVAATGRRSLDLETMSAWPGGANTATTGGGAAGQQGGGSGATSRHESPTPALRQQHRDMLSGASHVSQHTHARASAAAAAQSFRGVAARNGLGAPQGTAGAKPSRAPATRWYAHGGSDSDEDDDDLHASASMPAAPPVALRA